MMSEGGGLIGIFIRADSNKDLFGRNSKSTWTCLHLPLLNWRQLLTDGMNSWMRLKLKDCCFLTATVQGSIAIGAVQDERLGVCIGLVWNQRPGVSLGGQNGFLHRLYVLQPANREIGDVLVAQPHVFLTVLVDFGGPLHGVVADQRAVDQVRAPEIVDEKPIDKWRPHRRIAQNVLADQPLPQHRSVAMVEQKLAARQSLPAVAVAVAF